MAGRKEETSTLVANFILSFVQLIGRLITTRARARVYAEGFTNLTYRSCTRGESPAWTCISHLPVVRCVDLSRWKWSDIAAIYFHVDSTRWGDCANISCRPPSKWQVLSTHKCRTFGTQPCQRIDGSSRHRWLSAKKIPGLYVKLINTRNLRRDGEKGKGFSWSETRDTTQFCTLW